jgi:DNA (cytosine-5)-methyltransferase 1
MLQKKAAKIGIHTGPDLLVIDNFAGGGGASTGIEIGLNRSVDIAINHDEQAIAMHRLNHPNTEHYCEDVWHVDPVSAVRGRPVGVAWFSPDCTHHSQASGGQPRNKVIRGLSWVTCKWAGKVFPMCIMLENVEQIQQWGPLVAKRDQTTGRVIKLDKSVAAPGERVPVNEQYLIPNRNKKGKTWKAFIKSLEELGYVVQTKKLVAADFGAPTTRERLFLIARRDGLPIIWPDPTHAKSPASGKRKWRAAAECIDWGVPCPSIFTRKKGLAEATLRRIARGIQRYVVDNGNPFIVPIAHYNGSNTVHDINDPLRTIVSATKGGEFALAAPVLAKFRGDSLGTTLDTPVPTITSGGNSKRPAGSPHALGIVSSIMVQAGHGEGRPNGVQRWGTGAKSIHEPVGTIVASGGGHAVASAYLMQVNGGFNTTPGHEVSAPMSTITNTGSQQQLVAANLVTLRNCCHGGSVSDPVATITASGQHHGVVSALLSSYYTDTNNRCSGMDTPTETITTENRLGLVAASMVTTGYGERAGQLPRTQDIDMPLGTVVSNGKHAVVTSELAQPLSPKDEQAALRVAEFMFKYSGNEQDWDELSLHDRIALVSVNINGATHVIVDIGLRMMMPAELFSAQGFPAEYVIHHGAEGRVFSKSTQVRLVGNSVSPVIPAALVRANCPDMIRQANSDWRNWKKIA